MLGSELGHFHAAGRRRGAADRRPALLFRERLRSQQVGGVVLILATRDELTKLTAGS